MASQPTPAQSKQALTPVPVQKLEHVTHKVSEAVARRAYSLYLASGGSDGQDLAHWLQAESEVLTRIPEVREASDGFTVTLPLPGFSSGQINVGVDEQRVIVSAGVSECGESGDQFKARESVFIADWPAEVDSSTASAYLNNNNLTVTAKRVKSSRPAV